MSRLRVLSAAALASALAVGALTIPVAAAPDPSLVIGHGVPGVKVDICVNPGSGQIEVKSDFRYGKYFKATLPAGTYKFITRVASPGTCKGAVLIREKYTLSGGDDLSVIATKFKGTPGYAVFDNTEFDVSGAAVSSVGFSVKHAALIGRADVYIALLLNDTLADAPPTLEGVPKGAQSTVELFPADVKVGVAKTGGKIIKNTKYWEARSGWINHVVAVGGKNNLRFLRYRTPYTPSL